MSDKASPFGGAFLSSCRSMNSRYHLVLFDDSWRDALKPLSWTRPVCDFRIGMLTIREKWEKHLQSQSTTATAGYLEEGGFSFSPDVTREILWINSRVLPNPELAFEIVSLQQGQALIKGDLVVACNCGKNKSRFNFERKDHLSEDFAVTESKVHSEVIHRIADIFLLNGTQIIRDMEIMRPVSAEKLSSTVVHFGSHPVYMMKGVKAEACTFNTANGPIFIGENAEIMEGALLRGPLVVGAGAVIKMGAKIYGDTTIGPGCKVGGEVTNSVFFANSNKAHDGYIGNSVIGEWCNLGADTNTSNLKNNYGEVSVYNYAIGGNENTGQQFHGLIMGDHAKCGINTMFNTGTVVGVCANIFGGGFPEKFIPDFSWGGEGNWQEFRFEKALEMIRNVYKRREKIIGVHEHGILKHVFDETRRFRA